MIFFQIISVYTFYLNENVKVLFEFFIFRAVSFSSLKAYLEQHLETPVLNLNW